MLFRLHILVMEKFAYFLILELCYQDHQENLTTRKKNIYMYILSFLSFDIMLWVDTKGLLNMYLNREDPS